MQYAFYSGGSNPVLRIDSIGYSADPAVTRFGPSRRNQYIIHYCISGRGFFNGTPVTAGQGFLITPGMDEVYFPDENDPWAYLWVISEDPKMQDVFTAFQANSDTNVFSYNYLYAVKEMADSLVTANNRFYASIDLLDAFLKLLKPQLNARKQQMQSNAATYVKAAIHYIKANLFRPIFVWELTDFLGVSQPYLFKVFQTELGCSPKQYILQCKLEYSKNLLTETELSITQIAAAVGFEDVLNFSKFFSQRTGLSPKNYRDKKA